MKQGKRIIISGGGTGGHIFPAISVAQALRELDPTCSLLFVGAEGRMEMEKVPAAGFDIVGLPIVGFQRRQWWKNIRLPFLLWKSLRKAGEILDKFDPQVALGTGGYASGPLLWMASARKIPYVIQEQNSYPGVTNRLLARKAAYICTGYPDMTSCFPKEKIVFTGNPVRKDLLNVQQHHAEALRFFGFSAEKNTILVLGGSQGAKKINESMVKLLPWIRSQQVQVIWQTGKNFLNEAKQAIQNIFASSAEGIFCSDFLYQMHYAYAVADLVISRAGASTISEICLCRKAAILIPSPNVAEDHQTKNARALENRNAAVLLQEKDLEAGLEKKISELLTDKQKREKMASEAFALSRPDAAKEIAQRVLSLIS
jgi:UDP-N-acetylglucosamine--N-acetylmuramyl-(pentapeptide) pyrophosphoryl-undecaprenol N-acetylglucosamine transferase